MLYQKYPELKLQAPRAKTYTRLDSRGNLLEKWQKDDDGVWQDVTQQELAKIEIEQAARELALLNAKLVKTALNEIQVVCPEELGYEYDDDLDELNDF